MYIKFAHAFRLEDKNGEKRDMDIWNIAIDAIINANLERDRFTIKDGYVNRPDALKYSAEEYYQLLCLPARNQILSDVFKPLSATTIILSILCDILVFLIIERN